MAPDSRAWAPLPPRRTEQYYEVHYLREEREFEGIILSERLDGLWTHFVQGRTIPCNGDEKTCPGCIGKIPPQYSAFVSFQLWPSRRVEVLALTWNAATELMGLRDENFSLRGVPIRYYRETASNKSKAHVARSNIRPPGRLPAGFDVRPHLEKLWKVALQRATCVLPPVQGAAADRLSGQLDDVLRF